MNQGTKVKETQNPAGNPSEELYRILFEQSAVGIFISDADGCFIEINPRGCEMLGYTKSELLKHAMHDIVQPHEHKIDFPEPIALQNGKVTVDEKMMLRKDGSLFPAKVGFQKLSNGNLLQIIDDLSEQKIKENEILQLSRFPSENPNPVLRVSREGKILYANDASAELLEEWNTGVGGMLPSAWKKTTSRLADKRSSQNVEVPFRGRVYSMTITPVPDADYINLYGNDITEIKRSESALRQAEEKYRNIFEHSQDGIFQSTPSGKFITVNTALARIWGYDSPEDVIESITNIAHQVYVNPEQRQEFLRVMDENEEVVDFEFQAYRKDGGVIWVQENVRTVRDADGKVQYYEGTVKDITEQKHTLAALRHSEERYRSTLNNMMEGCQIIDFDWRYIYVNDTAAVHGRYKPEKMLMRTMMELYPGIEKTEMFATLQRCMENRIPERMENEFTFPDGEKGWFELSIQPVPEGLFILSIDISERKQAEIDLEDREARYRTLFESLPIPVFTKDREGRYTSFNAEESKYWAENPIGHTDFELLPAEIANSLRAVDQRVMQTEEPYEGEDKFQAPSGMRYLLMRKVPVYDNSGNVTGVLGAGLDITERKQAESALQDSEEKYRALFENAPVGIFRSTPDGRYLSVNPTLADMFGYASPKEVIDNVTDIARQIHVEASNREEFKRILAKSGETRKFINQNYRKDGSIIWTLTNARAVKDEAGVIRYYEGFMLDVTESKRAEKTLIASEERYRDLINNSQEFICTHDLDGNILSVNPWAEKILGYKQGELLKMNIADFLLPEKRSEFQNYLTEVQQNGRAKGLMTVQTRSGEKLIWEYNNSLKTNGGEQAIVRGMAHDVTKQRIAEAKIKQQLAFTAALNEIDHLITSSFDLNKTLDLLIENVSTQLGIDAVDILLVNSDANLLEFAVGRGFSGNAIQKARLRIGDEYAGRIVLERKTIQLPDLAKAEPPPNLAIFTKDEQFVAYIGLPLIAKGQIKGVLEVFQRSQLDTDEEWYSYLTAFAEQAAIAIDNAQLFNNLQQTNTALTLAYNATIEGWSYALDLRDKETEGHTQRVTEITLKLCEKFGLSEKEITYARWGGLLHDIGKMGIPDAILLKPGKLSDDEWVIMKMHPVFARKMLERVNYLKSAIDIPYYHHEKWDGSGYPEGLKGEQIPLTARIFAVADVWDALTSDRPYRPAWSKSEALKYIKSVSGTHLDSNVVEIFLESEDLWTVSGE